MKAHAPVIPVVMMLSLALFLVSCGSNGNGGGTPPATPPFSQTDLAGTWHVSILQSGPSVTVSEPGWMRGWASVDTFGHVTVTSFDTNMGTFPPSLLPWGMVWTIDPWTGIISETAVSGSTYANPDFHGKLAANKTLVIGTATDQNSPVPHPIQFRVAQKLVTGVTFTRADIANKAFMVHQIDTGSLGHWMFASGTTDTVGVATIPVFTRSTGTSAGGAIGTFAVHPGTGVVTMSSNTWFLGMMSSDKSVVIGTETDASNSSIYRLTVIQLANPAMTYSQADLGGTWSIHGILSAGAWLHATATISATGSGSTSSWTDSAGGSDPGPFTANLASSGVVSDPTDSSLHGFLAPARDLLVMTQTISGAGGMLTIAVK